MLPFFVEAKSVDSDWVLTVFFLMQITAR